MELTKQEQDALALIWNDEKSRNLLQKAFVIAAAATPDVLVGNLHTILRTIDGLCPENSDEETLAN